MGASTLQTPESSTANTTAGAKPSPASLIHSPASTRRSYGDTAAGSNNTTTTTTAEGTPDSTDCCAIGDVAESAPSWWRLRWWRYKNGVSAVCKPTGKVGPNTSSTTTAATVVILGDDVETGSIASDGTTPISPSTKRPAAAAVAVDIGDGGGGSSGLGIHDLGAAKGSNDRNNVKKTSCLRRLLTMYCDALDKWPVFTKSISSGLIGLLGDLLAQSVEWGLANGPGPWSDTRSLWRSCAVMFDGLFINGPLLHYCYEFLEKIMPAEESILASGMQVAVDVFVIDPVFGFIFVWSTGLIEGRSVKDDILNTLQHNYPTMVLWLIVIGLAWAPLQIYLFNKYPVQFRVLTADIIDLVWTCVSSFFCHAGY